MGSKGSNTTSQSTAQSWTPNADAMSAYQNLLAQIQQVGQTPYQAYTGQQVAGFTGDQQSAFQATRDAQGAYQPYLDSAGNALTGAMTPTYDMVGQYMNPYTQNVVDATRANMNHNNAVQQQQVVGNAALKGALGGDRVGVAQAELARGQKASDDQTIAGLYGQGYSQAITAAQSDKNIGLQGANLFNQLGTSAQNLGLQGANALYGMGSQQQQLDQANLNVPYQQFQEQRAYPYQQLQYLAGLTTGVGSQMGGSGWSNGTSETQTTSNPWNSIIGAGLTAASMFANGGRVGLAAGGGAMPYAGGGVYIPTVAMSAKPFQAPPQMQIGGGGGGGAKQGGPDASSLVDQAIGLAGKIKGSMNSPTDLAAPGVAAAQPSPLGVTAPSLAEANLPLGAGVGSAGYIYAKGGRVPHDPNGIYVPHLASGGVPAFADRWSDVPQIQADGTSAFFPNGLPPAPDTMPSGVAVPAFSDRWSPAQAAIASGDFDPVGANYTTGAPAPGLAVAAAPPPALQAINAVPPSDVSLSGRPMPPDDGTAPPALAYSPPPPDLTGANPSALNPNAGQGVAPAEQPLAAQSPQVANSLLGKIFGLSPEANQALMAAGLGMMASHSGQLGVAIGEGGLTGMKVYAEANKLKEAAARAREQLAERQEYHRETINERATAHDDAVVARREAADDRKAALARQAYPGEGTDADGKPVKGMYQYNPKTGEYDFKPGKVITSRAGAAAAGRTPANIQIADALVSAREDERRKNPDLPALSREDALNKVLGGAQDSRINTTKERLAAKAAQDEVGKFGDKAKMAESLNKWRQYYGLPVTAEQKAAAPAASAKDDGSSWYNPFSWGSGGDKAPMAKPTASAKPPAGAEAAGLSSKGELKPPPAEILAKARDAIKNKKDPEAVRQRLRENGYDPNGL